MPKSFVYVGKEEGSPDEITIRGLTFERNGDPVEVLDRALAEGLSGNPEFEMHGESEADYSETLIEEEQADEYLAQIRVLTVKNEDLKTDNDLLVSENRELREQIAVLVANQGNAPDPEPNKNDDSQSAEKSTSALKEIDAHEDWSAAPHPTRIRWANALSEGQVRTAAEADEIILGALVDREQDQD